MLTAMEHCRFVPSQAGKLYYVENWREHLAQKQQAGVEDAHAETSRDGAEKKRR
jgi:hypothetical protein